MTFVLQYYSDCVLLVIRVAKNYIVATDTVSGAWSYEGRTSLTGHSRQECILISLPPHQSSGIACSQVRV